MNKHYALVNGDIVLYKDATLAITDLSIQRGYGIFEFFKTVNGHPVFLDDHLDRFYFSAAELFLSPLPNRGTLKKYIAELMEKNNMPDAGMRVTLTGGYSPDGYTVGTPNLIITQTPFLYNKANFEKGVRLITYEHQRQLPLVKTIDYLQAVRLQHFIRQNNADDVLYHAQSQITECPRSNFFLVTGENEIITPAENILHGITRKKILAFSDFNIRAGMVTTNQLLNTEEAFITSTTKLVLPVLEINGKIIGNGKPGAVTRRIFQQLSTCQGI